MVQITKISGNSYHRRMASSSRAFTILEMLVSLFVLALIIVLMAQAINAVTMATTAAGKHVDSDSQVRCVFDRLGMDLNRAIKRVDPTVTGINGTLTVIASGTNMESGGFCFRKQAGNDEFYFYSECDGYYASSDSVMSGTGAGRMSNRNTTSLIGYRVNDGVSSGTHSELERLSRGLHWSEPSSPPASGGYSSVFFFPLTIASCFSDVIKDPYNNSSNLRPGGNSATDVPQWDVIGDQIFRFELSFFLTDGKISPDPFLASLTPSHTPADWRTDVVAIIVTVATLDAKSRMRLPVVGGGNVIPSSLLTLFGDTLAAGTVTVLEQWNGTLKTAISNSPTGIPQSVLSAVRIYQRYFYLNGQSAPTK